MSNTYFQILRTNLSVVFFPEWVLYFSFFLLLILIIVIIAFYESNRQLKKTKKKLYKQKNKILWQKREITANYHASQADREIFESSHNQFMAFFDNTIQAFILLDIDNKVINYNSLAQDYIINATQAWLQKGNSFFNYFTSEFCLEEVNKLLNSTKNNEKYSTIFHYKQKYVGNVWLWVQATPLKNSTENIIGTSISFFNYTRQKQDEEKIIRKSNELALKNTALQQLSSEKDNLMAVVAHDLRAPVNRIKAIIELMEEDEHLSSKQIEYLTLLKKISSQSQILINDLVDIHYLEQNRVKINPVVFEMSELIEECKNSYIPLANGKGISIFSALEPQNFQVNTDRLLILRILDNLISNAIKFSYKGREIFVKAELVGLELQLLVKDQGQGMNKQDLEKIFQKFQRLSAIATNNEVSSGLGLTIVKSIVDNLKGEITVSSELHIGTSFLVKIPTSKTVNHPVLIDKVDYLGNSM